MCICKCICACMHACMDRGMDGWMDGWVGGWMDGCMHACMCVYVCMYMYIVYIAHGSESRWLNSNTKIPTRWHRAVRKKTTRFWLEHKTSCAIYVACAKDPIEENIAPKSRHRWQWQNTGDRWHNSIFKQAVCTSYVPKNTPNLFLQSSELVCAHLFSSTSSCPWPPQWVPFRKKHVYFFPLGSAPRAHKSTFQIRLPCARAARTQEKLSSATGWVRGHRWRKPHSFAKIRLGMPT